MLATVITSEPSPRTKTEPSVLRNKQRCGEKQKKSDTDTDTDTKSVQP